MNLTLFALALSQWAAFSAHAQEDAFRLDVPGGTMEHVTALNQEDIGSCAYVATSYLIDAWRFSHGDTDYAFRTSETKLLIDASMLGNESELRKLPQSFSTHRKKPNWAFAEFSGGQKVEFRHETDDIVAEDPTIAAYQEFGSFSRAEENKMLGGWTDELQEDSITRGLRISSLFEVAKSHNTLKGWNGLKEVTEKSKGKAMGLLIETPDAEALMVVDPHALSFGVQLAPFNVVAQLQWLYMVTIAHKSPMKFESKGQIYAKPSRYVAFLKKHFKSRKAAQIQPVRIAYCAHVLQWPDYRGVEQEKEAEGEGIHTTLAADCGPHAGTVIGLRIKQGSLDFLVQDSNGPESGAMWPSEDGKYWVDADALSENMFFLNYFVEAARPY